MTEVGFRGLKGFAGGNQEIGGKSATNGYDVGFTTEAVDFLAEDDLNVGHGISRVNR